MIERLVPKRTPTVVLVPVVVLVLGVGFARAEVRLPAVLASHMVLQRDLPLPIWGWADPGEAVSVALDDRPALVAKADPKGNWKVTLPPVKADGKPHRLVVRGSNTIELEDLLIGEVWIGSGQSNMAWEFARIATKEAMAAADHPQLRLLHVSEARAGTPAADVRADWTVCGPATVSSFSAVLYYFGLRLHRELDVPVGLIDSSGGVPFIEAWSVTESGSGVMYNGMIAPLQPLAIRGALWYQGESDAAELKTGLAYYGKMRLLIEGWRKSWGLDLPFYYVQIAPVSGHYEPGQLPALWEAQVAALKIPGTGMAVITDLVDDIDNIHPRNKLDVGKRLALWALAKTYGRTELVHSGPLYKSMRVEGDTIRLCFAHAGGGLKSRDGKPLNEFQIAGDDGRFQPALAVVEGETVVVRAEGLAKPTQVRFGWHKRANPNLVNAHGLPASPFQTNNWQGGTGE